MHAIIIAISVSSMSTTNYYNIAISTIRLLSAVARLPYDYGLIDHRKLINVSSEL